MRHIGNIILYFLLDVLLFFVFMMIYAKPGEILTTLFFGPDSNLGSDVRVITEILLAAATSAVLVWKIYPRGSKQPTETTESVDEFDDLF